MSSNLKKRSINLCISQRLNSSICDVFWERGYLPAADTPLFCALCRLCRQTCTMLIICVFEALSRLYQTRIGNQRSGLNGLRITRNGVCIGGRRVFALQIAPQGALPPNRIGRRRVFALQIAPQKAVCHAAQPNGIGNVQKETADMNDSVQSMGPHSSD